MQCLCVLLLDSFALLHELDLFKSLIHKILLHFKIYHKRHYYQNPPLHHAPRTPLAIPARSSQVQSSSLAMLHVKCNNSEDTKESTPSIALSGTHMLGLLPLLPLHTNFLLTVRSSPGVLGAWVLLRARAAESNRIPHHVLRVVLSCTTTSASYT